MSPTRILTGTCIGILLCMTTPALADGLAVKITPTLESVDVVHQGKPVRIQRNQDQTALIKADYQKTSRRCPPFCIQPMHIADDVETIDELQMLAYLKRAGDGDDSVLVIDSRGENWVANGTLPGSINIPYKRLSLKSGDEREIAQIMEHQFGAFRTEQFWNFSEAKTLVLFCNGMWCGQAPTNIRSLLRIGYPPSKLKWYRGGMQAWEILGLTTVTP